MPSPKSDPLDKIFMALADGTRRQLVNMLANGDKNISDLTAPFDMSMAAISKHIKVLEAAGIVKRQVQGRTHILSLQPEQLAEALDWISVYRYFWKKKFNTLEGLLNEQSKPANKEDE